MDPLEHNHHKRIAACYIKKGIPSQFGFLQYHSYVVKLAGIVLKSFLCDMMVAQTKLEYEGLGRRGGTGRNPGVWIDRIWK